MKKAFAAALAVVAVAGLAGCKGDSKKIDQDMLSRMTKNDATYVGNHGYAIVGKYRSLGTCNDSKSDRSGWHGASTGIQYEVEKAGKFFEVCVSHKKEQVTKARAHALNPDAHTKPTPTAKPQVDRAQLQKLLNADESYLKLKGYSVVGGYQALGNCFDNATNDNSGWKGGNTGIQYEIAKGGKHFRACASHDNGGVVKFRAHPK